MVVADPLAAAKTARLRYVSDAAPGIRRVRTGTGFRYVDAEGSPVRDQEVLARIRALAVPPAWTDVWICAASNGHIQATGRDARGRKQYRYHARWREVRDETKYLRLIAFAHALPRIRERVDADLRRHGLPREKVVATVVRLLDATLIRVGNDEYARANRSFGLTTLRSKHVDVTGATLRFQFVGKGGKEHRVGLSDRRLARIVRQCSELPGQELFQYLDGGERFRIDSADVNEYLAEAAGEEFSAKDFRTWWGTVLAAQALSEFEEFRSQTEAKRIVNAAIDRVAQRLGNTRAIARKSYVHPAVIDAYMAGGFRERVELLLDASPEAAEDEAWEAAVLTLLEQCATESSNGSGNGVNGAGRNGATRNGAGRNGSR